MQELVQRPRARQVDAERLLDDDAPPALARRGGRQPVGAELLDDGSVNAGRDREIEEDAVGRPHLFQFRRDALVGRGRIHLATHVSERRGERRRHFIGHRESCELLQAAVEKLPELIVGHRGPRDSDHREPGGQALAKRQFVDCGEQLPFREIAGRTEDDERGRRRRRFDAQAVEKGVRGVTRRHGHTRLYLRQFPTSQRKQLATPTPDGQPQRSQRSRRSQSPLWSLWPS